MNYRGGRAHSEERRINLLAGERTKPIDPRAELASANRLTLFIDGGPKSSGVARLEVWGLAETRSPLPLHNRPNLTVSMSKSRSSTRLASTRKRLPCNAPWLREPRRPKQSIPVSLDRRPPKAPGSLAYYALFARDFAGALVAAERAHALAPDQLLILRLTAPMPCFSSIASMRPGRSISLTRARGHS